MTSTEMVRAGRADRDRYLEHLSRLFMDEYIEKLEFDGLRDAMLAVRTVDGLDRLLTEAGLPAPPPVHRPHDMSIPEHFYPHYLRRAFAGVAVAVIPGVALPSGPHHEFFSVVIAVFVIVGLMIMLNAVGMASTYAAIWANLGKEERLKRRKRDSE